MLLHLDRTCIHHLRDIPSYCTFRALTTRYQLRRMLSLLGMGSRSGDAYHADIVPVQQHLGDLGIRSTVVTARDRQMMQKQLRSV